MSNEDKAKYITISQVFSIVMTIFILIAGAFFVDMRVRMNDMQKDKLDRQEYMKDYEARNRAYQCLSDTVAGQTAAIEALKEAIIRHTAKTDQDQTAYRKRATKRMDDMTDRLDAQPKTSFGIKK